jgi:hypothetical protein
MYSRISIKNFRGIESLEVDSLRRSNLIVGRNNSGKTTFLEALFLLGGATDPRLPATLGELRGQSGAENHPDPVWRSLCRNLDTRTPVSVVGQWENEEQERSLRIQPVEVSSPHDPYGRLPRSDVGVAVASQSSALSILELRYKNARGEEVQTTATFNSMSGELCVNSQNRSDFIPTTLLSARGYASPARDAHQFSSLLKKKQDKDIIDALRIIEPSLQRIEILSEPGGPSIYLDLGLDALAPLAVCGEGMVRLFSIILELIASRNGVLLIDEIDNSLHYRVMPTFWKLLADLVERHNVQVFGTTHNDDYDALRAGGIRWNRGHARTLPHRSTRRPARHGRLQR